MSQYTFDKPGIQKIFAFVPYIQTNFPLYQDLNYTDPTLVIDTTAVLTDTELATLTTLVADYVDPAVFLTLSSNVTDPFISTPIIDSTSLTSISTFIKSSRDPNNGVLNAFKTVFEYSTPDVSVFATGDTTTSLTFQLYDLTNSVELQIVTVDISDIVQTWQTMAQASQTGPQSVFRTFMIEGVRNYISGDDCIWQFKVALSNANVYVQSHSVQSLYYIVQ
jgi:hypothetical protein